MAGARVRVKLAQHLVALIGGPAELDAEGATVAELLEDLERRRPGLRGYVVDDQGALREHVNLFVDGEPVGDRRTLADPLSAGQRIHILQSLSGG